jgi:hypothetical protein
MLLQSQSGFRLNSQKARATKPECTNSLIGSVYSRTVAKMTHCRPVHISTYRVNSFLAALEYVGTNITIIEIPAGTVLSVPNTRRQTGLIETCYQGRVLLVFIEDLADRARRIDEHSTPILHSNYIKTLSSLLRNYNHGTLKILRQSHRVLHHWQSYRTESRTQA